MPRRCDSEFKIEAVPAFSERLNYGSNLGDVIGL